MKKVIAVLVCVMLAVGISGCGGKSVVDSDSTAIRWVGTTNQPVELDSATQKFIEEKFNVKLDIVSITSSYYEKLGSMFASKDIPDVMFMNEQSNWQPLADQGIITAVSMDMIKEYAPNHYNDIENFNSNVWVSGMYKDRNWVIPKLIGDEYNTVAVWRKDWLTNVGIDKVPETLEEYEEAFIKIRNEDPDGNGEKDTYGMTGAGGATQRQFDDIFGAFGVMPGQWTIKDGKVENGTISEKSRDALELLNKWYDMELIDPEMLTDDQNAMWKKFDMGRTATMHTALSNLSEHTATGKANLENYKAAYPNSPRELGITALPKGPNGDNGDWLWGPRSNYIAFGIQLSKNQEKLISILKVLDGINYDEETALRVVFGEKGRTYDFIDPAMGAASGIKYLPPYDTDVNARAKEGIGQGGFFNMFSPASNWTSSEIMAKYINQDFLNQNREIAATGSYRDQLMRPDLPSSARFQGELDKLKTTAYSEFITGKRKISDWDAFVSEFNTKGGETLAREAQEYYEKYMK